MDSNKLKDLKKGLIRDGDYSYRFKEVEEVKDKSGPFHRYYNIYLIATDEELNDSGEEKKFECRSDFSIGTLYNDGRYKGIYTLSDEDHRSAFKEDFYIGIEAIDPKDRPLEGKIESFILTLAELDQKDLDKLEGKNDKL